MKAKKATTVSRSSRPTRKAPTKRAAKPNIKTTKKAAVKAATTKKVPGKAVVKLPTNMSQRSVEKSLTLKREFDRLYRGYVANLARVAGICFMLVGATAALSQILPDPAGPMTAQLPDSTSSTTTVSTASVIPPTVIALTSSIPPVVDTNVRIDFTANNVLNLVAKLRQRGVTGTYDLQTTKVGTDSYETTINWATFPVGYYEFLIYVLPENGGPTLTYKSTTFQIGNPPIKTTTSPGGTSDDPSGGSTFGDTSDSTSNGTTSSGTMGDGTASPDDTSADSGGMVDSPYQTSDTSGAAASIDQPFSLFTTNDSVLTGTEIIGINQPDDYTYVELYARPISSVNSRFVALATKRSTLWQFIVNSENIPNGDYEFFAQTRFGGVDIVSDSLRLRVQNSVSQSQDQTYVRPTIAPDSRPDSSADQIYDRPFYVVTDDDRPSASSSERLVEDVDRETRGLLQSSEANFSELFERYASAYQSGDENMIRLAEDELQKKRERLADGALQDERLQDIADNIDQRLVERVENVKKKIIAFEEIRKERSSGDSAEDTDGDGISDIDEISLYKTDPTATDSDNDGINDGVEIVRGFDPTSDRAEAVIRFESPKETVGLARPETLKIVEVTPLRKLNNPEDDTSAVLTSTEIRGTALPNSFVTLYIFSTPIVVTVKTDADGSFVYTFDKELEDGRHDVYAAVTDNTGEIIAQSNPFSFVKEAQAFTPVDAAESEVVSSESLSDQAGSSYGLVIGIAILSLGLILLMLGISLRFKKDNEIVITEADTDSSTAGNSSEAT